MSKPTIAIIDVIGLAYDGRTLEQRGLGGSESAVILMSKELTKVGFDVTVFNSCNADGAEEGVYDGVTYKTLDRLGEEEFTFDIMISSRTVIPFLKKDMWHEFNYPCHIFEGVRSRAKHKVVWLHDTFCLGDEHLEELVTSGCIDEIFTLSDFHTSYVTNCAHGGPKRNFEVLKPHVFMTRNGIVKYADYTNVEAKDPNLFVYNASVTKGMLPLIEHIWPMIRQHYLPDAKLKVIGGYYRFRPDQEPDEQEKKWHDLVKKHNGLNGVEFTGIIKQSEIAQILQKASLFLFPGAFPETFGISTLESLAYNTPLVCTRFGALEETAIEQACYKIDYAIEPNSLFPEIDHANQIGNFVDAVVNANRNQYLLRQKQWACNIVKDICEWETVAWQWKQHFYKKLGWYMNVDEWRKAQRINARVHQVFGRRYSNPEEWTGYRESKQKSIEIITPVWNGADYIERCIWSVAAQDYDNYEMVIIDDNSDDDTYQRAKDCVQNLPEEIRNRFMVMQNKERKGAVYNQWTYAALDRSELTFLLDGDDALVNDPNIFHMYNTMYTQDPELDMTYGSCWSLVDNIPLIAQEYPPELLKDKTFEEYTFPWRIPYTHLRTCRSDVMLGVNREKITNDRGEFLTAGGDVALFLEMARASRKIKPVTDVVVLYNDLNPLNDYKVNSDEQTKNADMVFNVGNQITVNEADVVTGTIKAWDKKKILIAIPTNKDIDPRTFKSIYDLQIPDGYEVEFQYFYGYNVDQVRNLIASWAVNYDYLFAVDHDVVFKPDTLVKLLHHGVDVVTGLYRQRLPDRHVLEVYEWNPNGGMSNIPYDKIMNKGLVQIAGCGFGCVLINTRVFQYIKYPWFEYHQALDHKNTISEDVDFCLKCNEYGFMIWADTNVLVDHVDGNVVYGVEDDRWNWSVRQRLRELSEQKLLPQDHLNYLVSMKEKGIEPKVIYDIGACVLHWSHWARKIWPEAEIVAFDAMDEVKFLWDEQGLRGDVAAFSDTDGKPVVFYQNLEHPSGNSYYQENEEVNPDAPLYQNESHAVLKHTKTIRTSQNQHGFPLPDLIKIDVQGCELDILKGMEGPILDNAKDIIVELQHEQYNKGAPLWDETCKWLIDRGWQLQQRFTQTKYDGDYHFTRQV